MARKLANQSNVQAPDSDYPFARIKDNPGNGTGTPVTERVYGDIHQFFAKLMNLGSVVPNDLPDNNYSGFQLITALLNVILLRIHQWSPTDFKIVEIGDWNMDSTVTVAVPHGLGDPGYKKIRNVVITIRDDADTTLYSGSVTSSGTGVQQVGVLSISNTSINLSRFTAGTFDTTGFDSTSFNRGWLIIEYDRD